MPEEIHPIKINGNWEIGYSLDVHVVSSQFVGYDELGREQFDTSRSAIGELLFRFKYRKDNEPLHEIVQMVLNFSSSGMMNFESIEVVVPVPPSNINRKFQPVAEIAQSIGLRLRIPVGANVIRKIKKTPELLLRARNR